MLSRSRFPKEVAAEQGCHTDGIEDYAENFHVCPVVGSRRTQNVWEFKRDGDVEERHQAAGRVVEVAIFVERTAHMIPSDNSADNAGDDENQAGVGV